MSQVAKKGSTLKEYLEDRKEEITKALPANMDPDKFIRVALTSVQKNPDLQRCSPASLWASVLEASALGLQLDGTLGQAYLVPYKNVATMLPGYRGLISLAKRSGDVQDVQARIVYEHEPFEILEGSTPRLAHQPLDPDKRGEIVGAYSRIYYRNGYTSTEFMWISEILKIKEISKAGDEGPWKDHPEEMIKKTVLRRHLKMADLSPEATRLAVRDEYHDAGVGPNGSAPYIPRAPQPIPGFELDQPASDLEVEDQEDPVTWGDVPEEDPKEAPGGSQGSSKSRTGKVDGKSTRANQDFNLEPESKRALEVTANIRELGESMGYSEQKIKKAISVCKGDMDKLEKLHGEYLELYTAAQGE